MTFCPQCKRKLPDDWRNKSGYYSCNKCRIFLYITTRPFPEVTEGMPLNAKIHLRAKLNKHINKNTKRVRKL